MPFRRALTLGALALCALLAHDLSATGAVAATKLRKTKAKGMGMGMGMGMGAGKTKTKTKTKTKAKSVKNSNTGGYGYGGGGGGGGWTPPTLPSPTNPPTQPTLVTPGGNTPPKPSYFPALWLLFSWEFRWPPSVPSLQTPAEPPCSCGHGSGTDVHTGRGRGHVPPWWVRLKKLESWGFIVVVFGRGRCLKKGYLARVRSPVAARGLRHLH